jgi:uncharacterized Zn finger protein (UPF0148 family)
MDEEKYKRSVNLVCPTCGCTEFNSSEPNQSESELLSCASCERELTRDELIHENSENINEHLQEIKKEVTKDLGRELKKQLSAAFRGSRFIKIK